MEKTRQLTSWEEFSPSLDELRRSTDRPDSLIYRGQSDASWQLDTTLERDVGKDRQITEYYKIAEMIRPQVEAFTEKSWPAIDLKAIDATRGHYDHFSRDLSFGKLPAYPYLAYLRHHGFPSPLLDWSSSPFVAAYFAFRKPSSSGYHAIYAFSEFGNGGKTRGSHNSAIYGFGPILSTHRRRFLQQSQYTVCVQFLVNGGGLGDWSFASHEDVFNRDEPGQDFLTKFLIPSDSRPKVLTELNQYNLTSFSLFGSEESLMEALAIQEFNRH